MQDNIKNQKFNTNHEDLNFIEFFNALISGRWIITSIIFITTIIAIIYSLTLPNIYESKAILHSVESKGRATSSMQNYSDLAGLVGVSLPSQKGEGNTQKAIKKMNSLSFFGENLMPKISLPNLMAVKSWDHKTGKLIYDKNIYDDKSNKWVRNVSYPRQQKPSAQESFEIFIKNHLNINENKKTGFISISIKHKSPYISKEWVELIFNEINLFYRTKDKTEAIKSLEYLNKQIEMTQLSDVRQNLAELIQLEIQKLTLVEANTAYVFDYIDPPVIMEKRSYPSRVNIIFLGLFFGTLLGCFIVLVAFFNKYDLKNLFKK